MIKYLGLKEGSEAKITLQRRFGKNNLERLARQYEEERANREWLDKSTMACPGCGVHTEKSAGCNHVCHFFRLLLRSACDLRTPLDDMWKMLAALLLSMW